MLTIKASSPLIGSSCLAPNRLGLLATGCASAARDSTRLLHVGLARRHVQLFSSSRLSASCTGLNIKSAVRWAATSSGHGQVTARYLSGSASRRDVNTPKPEQKTQAQQDKSQDKPRLLDTTKALQQRMKERFSAISTHENIYTIPNILTATRLLAAPAVGYLILHDQHAWAVALFAYAGVTDLVDGWIARKWNLQTVIGSVIDPMADKMLMTIVVVCLAIKGGLPLWVATIILGRDVSLGIAAFYYRYASLPAPKTFMRYWDFSLPSAEVHPTGVSKFNTFLQLVLIGAALSLPALSNEMTSMVGLTVDQLYPAFTGMQYVVAGTTLWSGGSYVWRKDVVKILGTDEALKKKQGFRGRAILGVSLAISLVLAASLSARQSSDAAEASVDQTA